MKTLLSSKLSLADIKKAQERIRPVCSQSPCQESQRLSEKYKARVFLKREDLQAIRSYKIRGAFNKIASLPRKNLRVACASAGNHAQGVALSCAILQVRGKIYMPVTTPEQKIDKVRRFGKSYVDIEIIGDSYDETYKLATDYVKKTKSVFIHAFNDLEVIQGQGTVGLEILDQTPVPIDYLFVPIGGGGIASGITKVFSEKSASTEIIGVEPAGAPAMKRSLEEGRIIKLDTVDTFVDGAVVKEVGNLNYEILKDVLQHVTLVPEGKICSTILELYNQDAIVVEPAGALSISALDFHASKIEGKTVVCIVSGGNNDIARMEEMKERSLLYEKRKHYFLVSFPQRAGALRDFLNDILGPNDDITYFQYSKKTNREKGPAVIGIELKTPSDIDPIFKKMKERNFEYEHLNNDATLFRTII